MATRTIKARVEIDGEKQYKQALSELNSGNKVLASEMKKLQAEYKGNAESVEFLNKKGDLLQRQLQQQKDKVQTLKDALANAAQKYGEADKRTQDWVVKLNNAEAAQFELEHAIEENNQALEGQDKEMTGLHAVMTCDAFHGLLNTEYLSSVLEHNMSGIGSHLHDIGQFKVLFIHQRNQLFAVWEVFFLDRITGQAHAQLAEYLTVHLTQQYRTVNLATAQFRQHVQCLTAVVILLAKD